MDKMITVARYINSNEAYIVKGLLESHGIQCYLFDELSAISLPPLTMGGVRLAVKESDLERTQEILKDINDQ